MRTAIMTLGLLLIAAGCQTGYDPLDEFGPVPAASVLPAPAPQRSPLFDTELTEHGQYLVELLGCGACHTQGARVGEPDSDLALAGSTIGLAHSNPLQVDKPGVVFGSNLTPDPATGIGAVPDEVLARAIGSGLNRHGRRGLRVMPVAAYSRMSDRDIKAVIAYLRSLPPVEHRVPDAVPEGEESPHRYVHFGVYMNRAN